MKTLSKILSVVAIMIFLRSHGQAQFTFITNADKTLTLTGYIGSLYSGALPSSINGLPVTGIADNAFYSNPNAFRDITIPDSIWKMGTQCFYSSRTMTNLVIGNGITNISDKAFEGCMSLKNVTFGTNVARVGFAAFWGPNVIKSITLPDSVTEIGASAFTTTVLTNINFGSGVRNIGDNALASCMNLVGPVRLPNSLTNLGAGVFEDCRHLTGVTFGTNLHNIGPSAFLNCYVLQQVAIPGSVANIGSNSFKGCSSLSNVTLLEGLCSIGSFAFSGCSSLTDAIIPSSVTNIDLGAFAASAGLLSISVNPSNQFYSSLDGILFNKDQTTLIQCPAGKVLGTYTLPESVASIGGYAFYTCTGLTNLIFPATVRSIGAMGLAFSSLQGVYFYGSPPAVDGLVLSGDPCTIYYLPGTTGWTSTFPNWPTAFWVLPNPVILSDDSSLGVKTNQFGFTISWATNASVVVEGCTNLTENAWDALATNLLTNGSWYFNDPDWTNYPVRLYRAR